MPHLCLLQEWEEKQPGLCIWVTDKVANRLKRARIAKKCDQLTCMV